MGLAYDQNLKHRPTMEDEHVHLENCGPGQRFSYYAIYDGHGGRQVVDMVAERLHEAVFREIGDGKGDVQEALSRAFLATDEAIIRDNTGGKSGCTAAVALIEDKGPEGRVLWVANAGDARIVLARKDKPALRLTHDHKPTDSEENKLIQERGGLVIRGKVGGQLGVSRAFGDADCKKWITAAPYTQVHELAPEDSVIVIACDGLWDVCDDQTAADLIRGQTDPDMMASALVKEAIARETTDNVSVMCVSL